MSGSPSAGKALCDNIVPLNRWYPYSRDGNQAYPVQVVPSSEGDLIQYVVAHGAGVAGPLQVSPLSDFVTRVRWALPDAIERAERRTEASRRLGYGADTQSMIDAELAELQSFAQFNEPLPMTAKAFEAAISADVVVKAGPESGPDEDLWIYIDSITGGCCNSMMRSVDGEAFYEGTWRGDEIEALIKPTFSQDRRLTVCAVSLRVDPECEHIVSPNTRNAITGLPSHKKWNDQNNAEHAAWLKPRLEQLLLALRSRSLVEDATFFVPSDQKVLAHRVAHHDTTLRQVSLECEYQENAGDGHVWRVTMTGSFSPEGDLESVTGLDSIRKRNFTLDLTVKPATASARPPR